MGLEGADKLVSGCNASSNSHCSLSLVPSFSLALSFSLSRKVLLKCFTYWAISLPFEEKDL